MGATARAVLEIVTDTSQYDAGVKGARASAVGLSGELKGLAGTLGIAFGGAAVVGGVKALATATLAYAGNITDLSAKMGVSTNAAQGWKFAAEQTGSSLEDVSKAVLKLSQGLSSGDKGLDGALKAAGLSMQQLRAMKPEDAFNAAAVAIAKIPNPMDQARVAMELFGKSGAALLPGIRDGFIDIANEAPKMSAATIKALDDAQDAWDKLGTTVVIVSGEILAGTMSLVTRMTSSWKQFFQFTDIALKGGISSAIQFAQTMDAVGASTSNLAQFQQNAIKELLATGAGFKDVAKAVGVSEAEVAKFAETLKPVPPLLNNTGSGSDAAAKAAERLAAAFQQNVDVLTGKALADEIAELARQVAAAEKQGGLSDFQYKKLGATLADNFAQGARIADLKLREIWLSHERLNPSIKVTVADYEALAAAMKLVPSIQLGNAPPPLSLPVSLGPIDVTKIGQQIGQLQPPPEIIGFGQRIGSALSSGFSAALAGLGGVIVGAIQGGGNVAQAAFASIGGSLGASLGAEITKSLTASLGKGLAGAIGGIFGPLGALAGQALGGLFSKIGGLFTNQGRNDAKAYAASFGGFDALRQEMLKLGDEGDRLWKKLTQNTKGPAQVAATIKEIEDAFRRQGEAATEAANAAEDALQREEDAVTAASAAIQATIDSIQAEYDSLASSIANEMPEEIMGITEANTRAAMAALQVQKKAAEDELALASKKVTTEAEVVKEGIKKLFSEPFRASVIWDIPPFPYPGGSGGGSSSGGGTTTPSSFTRTASAAFARMAAMTAGVVTRGTTSSAFGGSFGGATTRTASFPGRPLEITVVSKFDSKVVASEVVKVTPGLVLAMGHQ